MHDDKKRGGEHRQLDGRSTAAYYTAPGRQGVCCCLLHNVNHYASRVFLLTAYCTILYCTEYLTYTYIFNIILYLLNGFPVQTLLFLQDRLSNSFTLGQRDQGLIALANHKHVGNTGGKGVSSGILDVHNIKRTLVLFLVDNGTDTAVVVTPSGNAQVADIELDEVTDLAGLEV